jgi:hypothetical protein
MDVHDLRGARRVAAADQLGRRHPYLTLYGRTLLLVALLGLAGLGVFKGGSALVRAWHPNWAGIGVAFALVGVVLLLGFTATRSRRRGYRLPRGRY